jgi:hypothetical protein
MPNRERRIFAPIWTFRVVRANGLRTDIQGRGLVDGIYRISRIDRIQWGEKEERFAGNRAMPEKEEALAGRVVFVGIVDLGGTVK